MIALADKIQKALDRVGEHTLDDVAQRIAEQRAFPFIRNNSAVIVELYPYLRHSELACWIVAGDMADCWAVMPDVEDFGRYLGAKYIRGAGRPGWKRFLEPHGWKVRDVVMYKEL